MGDLYFQEHSCNGLVVTVHLPLPCVKVVRVQTLLFVTGERYVPGVGRVSADDFMRREIIHKLFLRPMTHSELIKALPLDTELEDEEGVDGTIDSVSTFK